ncbi:MAG: adenylate kinase [Flavobacteriaceae bacterium]|nr:adenylate kinase [Flavobacteriaceae bacterium]
MLNIALFGPPGAGKGTQSQLLIDKYNLAYISTGEILRKEITTETVLGLKAKTRIEHGELVDDEIIVQIIEGFIEANSKVRGVLFDGFPRTYVQAYILEGMLQRLNSKLSCMISLEVPKDELRNRMLERAKTSGRADDTKKVIENRLKEYELKTAPVAKYYKERGLFNPVSGTGDIDTIFSNINEVIQETLKDQLFNVVLLGMPGAGKGSQANKLAKEFGLHYISTGKMLRNEIHDKTELGEQASGYMRKGDIAPDEIAIKLIEREINNNPNAKGFIFKGYPRSIVQAYILDGLLRKRDSTITLVIDLKISMLEAFKRLVERGKTESSRNYDANPETIIKRIEGYENISSHVPQYYNKKLNVVSIDGSGSKEDVYQRLKEAIEDAY